MRILQVMDVRKISDDEDEAINPVMRYRLPDACRGMVCRFSKVLDHEKAV